MAERTLYQFVLSPYCAKVRWALEWKRLDYDAVECDPLTRREPRSTSGQGKVPVLKDRAKVVVDSTGILAYLDAAYPARSLIPHDGPARARALALEDWADEVFLPDLIAFKMLNGDNPRRVIERTVKHHVWGPLTPLKVAIGPLVLRRLGRARLKGRSVEQLREDYEKRLDLLDGMLAAQPYLLGDAPTVFDATVWGGLWSMKGLEGEQLLDPRGRLALWFRRMKSEI